MRTKKNKTSNPVFEKRNKIYGTLILSKKNSDHHINLIIVIAFLLILISFLELTSSIMPKKNKIKKSIKEVTIMDLKQKIPEKNQLEEMENASSPIVLKKTKRSSPQVIEKNKNFKNEQLTSIQQELIDLESTELNDLVKNDLVKNDLVKNDLVKNDLVKNDLVKNDLVKNDTSISVAIETIETKKKDIDTTSLQNHKVLDQEKIFTRVETPPSFPGGEKKLIKWLGENINYPSSATKQGIQGRVVLHFVVRSDGMVDNVKIIHSLEPNCDEEAVRVIKKMPKWISGKHNGTAVSVYCILPILFKLQN